MDNFTSATIKSFSSSFSPSELITGGAEVSDAELCTGEEEAGGGVGPPPRPGEATAREGGT